VLLHKLKQADRLDVAEEEFKLLESRTWQPRETTPADWQRVKGSKALDVEGKRALRALYAYRDEQARTMDRPPYKVIPDPFLLRVAQVRPQSLDQLRSLAKRRSNMIRRHGANLVEHVRKGLANDAPFLDPPKKRRPGAKPPHGGRDTERLLQRLKGWRTQKQENTDLPVAMLASNAQLKVLAGWRPQTVADIEKLSDIRTWQVTRYGQAWIDIISEFEQSRKPSSTPDPSRTSRRRRRRRNSRSKSSETPTNDSE